MSHSRFLQENSCKPSEFTSLCRNLPNENSKETPSEAKSSKQHWRKFCQVSKPLKGLKSLLRAIKHTPPPARECSKPQMPDDGMITWRKITTHLLDPPPFPRPPVLLPVRHQKPGNELHGGLARDLWRYKCFGCAFLLPEKLFQALKTVFNNW